MNQPKVTCRDVAAILMSYLDKEMDPEQLRAFEKHLVDCPPCGDFIDSYEKTIRLGRECGEDRPALPPRLERAIVEALKKQRRED